MQLARSLGETDRILSVIRARTLAAVLVTSVVAALLAWLIGRTATRRLARLTETAEVVATTGRLDVDVDVDGNDEAGRLADAFNSMLVALATSRDEQHRLVQDAGHELRTPLTSLRTNVSVLRRYDQLTPEIRGQVLDDLEREARELTTLVNEIVEVATDRRDDQPTAPVSLREVVDTVADRTRRRTGRVVLVVGDDSVVDGRRSELERAVRNLLENATKFAPGDSVIEVTVRAGRVSVDDRGPGIAADDLPHLFDRFYRAVDARSSPGSGLGLSIVDQVVRSHHGHVFADNRQGGGASIGFVLPVLGVDARTP
ncbi:MAG: HAMP domain-containing sensor histidine kinase [Ilumatobacteraceae bacterium]